MTSILCFKCMLCQFGFHEISPTPTCSPSFQLSAITAPKLLCRDFGAVYEESCLPDRADDRSPHTHPKEREGPRII
jgi:hypothetical protein